MPDVFTPAKRSAVMSLIRSRGNRATELRLIALMREHGITGWRRNAKVFGKPDFVFRRERVAISVDGCFWHGCPRHATTSANNRAFWKAKLARNTARDRGVRRATGRCARYGGDHSRYSPGCIASIVVAIPEAWGSSVGQLATVRTSMAMRRAARFCW